MGNAKITRGAKISKPELKWRKIGAMNGECKEYTWC
jgi:hypothetical protein